MEKVLPWCGQPSDRGRLKNRTEQNRSMRGLHPMRSPYKGGQGANVPAAPPVKRYDIEPYNIHVDCGCMSAKNPFKIVSWCEIGKDMLSSED